MKNMCKLTVQLVFFLFSAINLVACGGGSASNSTASNAIVYPLPNGSTLIVPVSTLDSQVGNNTSTTISIIGGSPNLDVTLSASSSPVLNLNSGLNGAVVSESNPIGVMFNPVVITSGTDINTSTILLAPSAAASAGNYKVTLYATYIDNNIMTTNVVGVITINVSANPIVTTGALTFTPESAGILLYYSTTGVLSLNNSSGVKSLIVNVATSDGTIAQVSPAQCVLSTESNYCDVTISAASLGTATITADTYGYESVSFSANVAYGFGATFLMVPDSTYSNLLIANLTVSDYSGAVSTCKITNGSLNACHAANVNMPMAAGVAVNNAGDVAYITGAESIVACQLANGDFSNCLATPLVVESAQFLSGITLNKQNNYAYVAAFTESTTDGVYRCNVTGQTVSDCQNLQIYPSSFATGITFNQSESIVYINSLINQSFGMGSITQCNVSNGSFESCVAYPAQSTPIMPGQLKFSPDYTYMYMTEFNFGYNSNLSVCDMESTYPINCRPTGSLGAISAAIGIAFAESVANTIFVSDFLYGRIFACNMSSPTTASSCLPTGTP